MSSLRVNVGRFVREAAAADSNGCAIAAAVRGGWQRVSFGELDLRSDAIAHGLAKIGVRRGDRALVMVRAGVDLIALTYALFKLGAVPVLIDPGMGRAGFLRCVATTAPDVFIGIPLAHLLRLAFPASFRSVTTHVTVGRRWLWTGATLAELEASGRLEGRFDIADTSADNSAAVLFTSGSTGPAKGALYTHGMFEAQVKSLRASYGFVPGEIDLACFPLFSLFDCAFRMTSVIPDLDPSRPGRCDPARVVAAIRENHATSAFGSPAIWRRVAPWCLANGVRLPTLRRVLIAGASVPAALIAQLHELIAADGDVYTPYGATEALPVATIAGREVVGETAASTRRGAGTCVGRPAPGIDVQVIRVSDEPIPRWSADLLASQGDVGEICVKGPVVTREYDRLPEATALAKINDNGSLWHRMGDLGRFDAEGRLWFAGRKAERLETAAGPLYTDHVEGIALGDPRVTRCALVGVGPRGGERPVLIVEGGDEPGLARDLRAKLGVAAVLFHPRLPTDTRHNSKIHRLKLRKFAASRLGVGGS